MKKIKSFNLHKLQINELGGFARNLFSIVKSLVASKQIPEPLVVDLEQSIKRYEVGVGPKVDKVATERSLNLSHECSEILLAIRGSIRVAKHRTPEHQLAAQHMEDAIRNHGWEMHHAAHDVESNSIKLLLADINASVELKASAVKIGCDDLIDLLAATDKKRDESEAGRKAKEQALGGINSYEAVKGLNVEIQRTFDYLNSVSAIYPEVETAIDQINLQIDPLVVKIKTRATVAENKKKEEQNPPKQ